MELDMELDPFLDIDNRLRRAGLIDALQLVEQRVRGAIGRGH
jgi:hypothetical protein